MRRANAALRANPNPASFIRGGVAPPDLRDEECHHIASQAVEKSVKTPRRVD
jgi:hypothetical protein